MKKFINKKYLLLALLIIGIIAFSIFYFRPYITFPSEKVILEKGEKYLAKDYIVKANGQVEMESEYLPSDEIGKREFTYTVSKGGFTRKETLHYEVVDTTPPVIKVLSYIVEIEPNQSFTMQNVLDNIVVDEGLIAYDTNLKNALAGDYEVNIAAEDESNNISHSKFVVRVKDLIAPFVFNDGDGTELLRGSKFNIHDHISYGDNVDDDPTLTVYGAVNTNRIGTYPLHASLVDKSGNKTEWYFDVNVVSAHNYDDSSEDDEVYLFEDFKKDYQKENRMLGIDVSEWQGEIDFEKIKEEGCEFVMMRIGFSRNGELILDQSFEDYFYGAKMAGLPVGIYYYSHDSTKEEVSSVLDQIFYELGGESLELPIVFDWENFSGFQGYKVSFKELNELYDHFEKQVRQNGYQAMLYGSRYYLENVWTYSKPEQVWLAHYVDSSSYTGPYQMWQRCAWGRMEGVQENVDFDIMFLYE